MMADRKRLVVRFVLFMVLCCIVRGFKNGIGHRVDECPWSHRLGVGGRSDQVQAFERVVVDVRDRGDAFEAFQTRELFLDGSAQQVERP